MTTLVKPLQPSNADSPMEVTELGMTTLVNPSQLLNSSAPMLVTLLPMVRFSIYSLLWKGEYPYSHMLK